MIYLTIEQKKFLTWVINNIDGILMGHRNTMVSVLQHGWYPNDGLAREHLNQLRTALLPLYYKHLQEQY